MLPPVGDVSEPLDDKGTHKERTEKYRLLLISFREGLTFWKWKRKEGQNPEMGRPDFLGTVCCWWWHEGIFRGRFIARNYVASIARFSNKDTKAKRDMLQCFAELESKVCNPLALFVFPSFFPFVITSFQSLWYPSVSKEQYCLFLLSKSFWKFLLALFFLCHLFLLYNAISC